MKTADESSAASVSSAHFSAGPLLATPERPWLGLIRFTEAEKDYFYGRNAEIAELRDRVVRAPLTILYGVSGYGKSSLLGAGLVPALRAENLLPIPMPRFSFDDPKAPPIWRTFDEIRKALPVDPATPPSRFDRADSFWEFFHDRSLPWWRRENPSFVQPVLIFDQFEDIFTQGEDKGGACAAAASDFLTAIADLVENRPPAVLREKMRIDRTLVRAYDFQSRPVKVVIALREDFLARLERWRRVLPGVVENRVELRLLSGTQALQAVLEPGRKRAGKPAIVGDNTAAAIVRFVAGAGVDLPLEEIDNVPPLLSLICAQLNERRFPSFSAQAPERDDIPMEWVRASPSGRLLSATTGDDAPLPRTAAEEVLENFYTTSFAQHPPAVRRFAEDKLVSDAGFRETVTLDTALNELRSAGVQDSRPALDRLVDQRLLTIEDRGGVTRVEFTHDILAALAIRSRERRKEEAAVAAREAAEAARAAEERRRTDAERLREQAVAAQRRARRFALLTSVIALAAVAAFLVALYFWNDAASQRRAADEQRTVANDLRDQAVRGRSDAIEQRQEADKQRQNAEEALKAAKEQETAAKTADANAKVAVEKTKQALLQVIPYRLCFVLASNNPEETEEFWAPLVWYYDYNSFRISRKLLISQHRRDSKQYPFRTYTVTTTPTVSADPDNAGWVLKFGMNYTLLNPQRKASTGELEMTMGVDSNYQVKKISQKIIRAKKE